MSERIFIDSDILLDVIFKREPFFDNSQKILSVIENNIYKGYTSSLIIANCYYIIGSNISAGIAGKTIAKLRSILVVLPFTDREIGESLNSGFRDFEDGVQYFIAVNNGIRTIITRNIGDYRGASINVLTPSDFFNLIKVREKIEGKS